MQSKILENKLLVEKNGEKFVDLTTKSIEYSTIGKAVDIVLVGEDMCMRPDLLSKSVFGNDEDYDMLLKYNGISNPFSINENDLIYVPDLSFMYESLYNPEKETIADDIRNQYIDKTKAPIIDANKSEYDRLIERLQKTTTNTNLNTYGLPPNISEPGEKEGRVTANGNLIFGDYVTKSK